MKGKIIKSIHCFYDELIMKQGVIKKKSEWLGLWRQRKIVLFENRISFYSDLQMKETPTLQLFLVQVKKITDENVNNKILVLETQNGKYQLEFDACKDKQQWKHEIGKAVRNFKIRRSQFMSSLQKLSSYKQQKNTYPCIKLSCF